MCRSKKKYSCEKKGEGDTWHYLKKINICKFQSNNATVAKTRGCWNLQVNLIVVIQLIVLLVLLMSGDFKKNRGKRYMYARDSELCSQTNDNNTALPVTSPLE